mmetsp:Transcript_27394/g.88495  ORF Transcript_27394/g.88495 Transcript_27394/m.88495 type:complete len:250 (+) Transcript_27394:152-901(+)
MTQSAARFRTDPHAPRLPLSGTTTATWPLQRRRLGRTASPMAAARAPEHLAPRRWATMSRPTWPRMAFSTLRTPPRVQSRSVGRRSTRTLSEYPQNVGVLPLSAFSGRGKPTATLPPQRQLRRTTSPMAAASAPEQLAPCHWAAASRPPWPRMSASTLTTPPKMQSRTLGRRSTLRGRTPRVPCAHPTRTRRLFPSTAAQVSKCQVCAIDPSRAGVKPRMARWRGASWASPARARTPRSQSSWPCTSPF